MEWIEHAELQGKKGEKIEKKGGKGRKKEGSDRDGEVTMLNPTFSSKLMSIVTTY